MIEGLLVNLRAIEDEDIELLHRWFNDREVTRFLSIPFPAFSLAEERAIVQRQREGGEKQYAIVLKDGPMIGACTLRGFDHTARSCELAIAIGDKRYWGRGYGGAAVELLLRVAFDGLNQHRVWLTCIAFNERGLRAYRRLGFREEGRLRDNRFIDGRYEDTIMMGMLEDEWRQRAQSQQHTEAESGADTTPR